MNAKPFEERAIFKVGAPAGIVGVRRSTDFEVTANTDARWGNQPQPDRFVVRRSLTRVDSEHFLIPQ